MIYRVLCSTCQDINKLEIAYKYQSALDIKLISSIKEIEADSFFDAAVIFDRNYGEEIDALAGRTYSFYRLDAKGNIIDS